MSNDRCRKVNCAKEVMTESEVLQWHMDELFRRFGERNLRELDWTIDPRTREWSPDEVRFSTGALFGYDDTSDDHVLVSFFVGCVCCCIRIEAVPNRYLSPRQKEMMRQDIFRVFGELGWSEESEEEGLPPDKADEPNGAGFGPASGPKRRGRMPGGMTEQRPVERTLLQEIMDDPERMFAIFDAFSRSDEAMSPTRVISDALGVTDHQGSIRRIVNYFDRKRWLERRRRIDVVSRLSEKGWEEFHRRKDEMADA